VNNQRCDRSDPTEGFPDMNLPIAYIINQFPASTETFVIGEVREIRKAGANLAMYALRRGPRNGAGDDLREALLAKPLAPIEIMALAPIYSRVLPIMSRSVLCEEGIGSIYAMSKSLDLAYTIVHAARVHLAIQTVFAGEKPHLHAHFAGRTARVCLLLSQLEGYSYSVTVHAADIYSPRDEHTLARILRHAVFVVCISAHGKELLLGKGWVEDPSKVHVIHCGVDPKTLSMAARTKNTARKKKVLSVGRLIEKKGHRYLIEAASLLNRRGIRDIEWIIVGDGPQLHYLERRSADLGLSDHVKFVGRLPHAKVLDLLQEATAMVLPCVKARNGDMDGIPVALMEAMVHGVPVISTRVGGIPELVQDQITGILVDPEDAEALANAIRKLLVDDELAHAMARAGLQRVRDQFNLTKNANKLFGHFRKYIGRNSHA